MKTRWVLLLLLACAAAAFAQQQPYFQTFEVRLHNLEVQVTDSNGNPVRGLTKDDFVVLEEGVEQNVTNFSVYDASTSTRVAADNGRRAESPSVQQETRVPRRFVFFVDHMSLRKPVRKELIENANALLDQLQPGDLAAVVRPEGERLRQPFTTDVAVARKAVAEAIESCKLGFGILDEYERRSTSAFAQADMRHAQATFAHQTSERVQQRLAQLRALVGSMAGIEGRKVIIILTDGLPSIPGRIGIEAIDQMRLGVDRQVTEWGPMGDFNPLIDELGRTAAANGVTIYALEPQVPLAKGLKGHAAASNVEVVSQTDAERLARPVVPSDTYGELMHFRAQTLRSLAEKTGGEWTRGVPMIDDLFRQVVTDLRFYYSLAYRANGDPNKPRKVKVVVRNRPELHVRTRSEVMDRPPEREMGDLVASTLIYPRDVNELRMAVETGAPKRGKSTVYVPVEVVIPLETLTFMRAQDKYVATIDIHHATSGYERSSMTSGRQRQTFELSESDYARRNGMTYRFKSGIEVWPGKTRIAIGAMDVASHLVGFRTMDVEAK
jgi:VWFA-related protein